jgi:hypothetical protein
MFDGARVIPASVRHDWRCLTDNSAKRARRATVHRPTPPPPRRATPARMFSSSIWTPLSPSDPQRQRASTAHPPPPPHARGAGIPPLLPSSPEFCRQTLDGGDHKARSAASKQLYADSRPVEVPGVCVTSTRNMAVEACAAPCGLSDLNIRIVCVVTGSRRLSASRGSWIERVHAGVYRGAAVAADTVMPVTRSRRMGILMLGMNTLHTAEDRRWTWMRSSQEDWRRTVPARHCAAGGLSVNDSI